MVKFLNSLCCCIYSVEVRKSRRHQNEALPSSNAHSIITQITPDNANHQINGNNSTSNKWTIQQQKNIQEYQQQQQQQQRHNNYNYDNDDNGYQTTTFYNKNLSPTTTATITSSSLLGKPSISDTNKKCLVVDLDETLVHSSFKPVKNADFIIPVEIDNIVHQVYVLKRPYTDEFLEKIGPLFECVLFTASLAKYADPVADLLDKKRVFKARLFRESCVYYDGNYIKDLDRLGRNVNNVIIIDNSPASYAFHPKNAVPIRTWFDDPNDTELLDIIPILQRLAKTDNIYQVLRDFNDAEQQYNSKITYDDNNHTVIVSSGQIGININNGNNNTRPTTTIANNKEFLFSPNVGTDKVTT